MLVALLLLLLPALAADAWFEPLPSDTSLRQVEEHGEYRRLHLRTDDVDYVLEITPSRVGSGAVCTEGGFDLFVRRDLDAQGESFDWEPLPDAVDQVCERLAVAPPLVEPEIARVDESAAPPIAAPAPGLARLLLRGLGVAWVVLVLAALGRSPNALGVLVISGVVRVLFARRTVLLGGDAAYERLQSAQGLNAPDLYYGETWPALMGLVRSVWPSVSMVHSVNIAFSTLAPALVVVVVERLGGGRLASLGAGLILALLPVPVLLAGTEIHFVLVSTLQLAAVAGALSRNKEGDLLSVSALGLLVFLRPLQAIFALLVLGLLALGRRWPALGVCVLLLGWRTLEVLSVGADGSLMNWGQLLEFRFWFSTFLPGTEARDIGLNPLKTPFALPLIGMGGLLWLMRERPRIAFTLGAAFGLSVLPVITKTFPDADALRFQLPVQAWWAVLGGFGLARAAQLHRVALPVLAGALVVGAFFARDAVPRWAWMDEHAFWVEHVPNLQEGTVWMDASQDPHGHVRDYLERLGPARWEEDEGGAIGEGDYVYVGFANRVAKSPGRRCSGGMVAEEEGTPMTDGWVDLGEAPLTLKLSRCQRATGPVD